MESLYDNPPMSQIISSPGQQIAEDTYCNCIKSRCQNRYCSCLKAGLSCTPRCGCSGCKNNKYHSHQTDAQEAQQVIQQLDIQGQQKSQQLEGQPLNKPMETHHLKNSVQDPIQKAIDRAELHRKQMKQSKLQQRREAGLNFQNQNLNLDQNRKNYQFRVLTLNVRGIQSQIKQEAIRNFLKHNRAEVIGLTETRLKDNFRVRNMLAQQTRYDSKGGVWSAVGGTKQTKNIKYVQNQISYQSLAFYNTPIHVITCYFSPVPEDSPKVKMGLQHLKYMIINIFKNYQHSKLIVQGDFNNRWINEVSEFLQKYQIKPIFEKGQATHQLGGQLDQIFTNLTVLNKNIMPVTFSDHYALQASLLFEKTDQDLDLKEIPTYIKQKDIRKEAISQELIEKILSQPEILKEPLLKSIETNLKRSKKIQCWYRAPPKWFLFKETNGERENRNLRNTEWQKLMQRIEQAFKNKDMKTYFQLVKQATSTKKQGTPIQGITIDGVSHVDQSFVEQEVLKFFGELYQSKSQAMETQSQGNFCKLFTIQDIIEAIESTNFEKGIGPDAFDGRILKNEKVKILVAQQICEHLNTNFIPPHFMEGRLILLSKKRGQEVVPLESTRPIVVNSHLYKVCEKAIIRKIDTIQSKMLLTSRYQQGFKKNASTHVNIIRMLNEIFKSSPSKQKQKTFILVDLKKAYDSLDRKKLIQILSQRANSPEEKSIVTLIGQMIAKNKIWYGQKAFWADKGVVQGGVLSPSLFNIYLDDALNSQKILKKLLSEGKLLAFADDLMIRVSNQREFKEAISALDALKESHGLAINKDKTVFISNDKQFESIKSFVEIKKVSCAKYLGINFSLCRKETIKFMKEQIQQSMLIFKNRIHIQEPQIQETLYTTYLRSLIIYFTTPMVAAGLLQVREVRKLEALVRRRLMKVPNDIKSDVILNVSVSHKSDTATVVMRLAAKAGLQATLQPELETYLEEKHPGLGETKSEHNKLYVERSTLDLMMAVTQKRTTLHFHKVHYCNTHQRVVDQSHITDCSNLKGAGQQTRFNRLLEQKNIRQMNRITQFELVLTFQWLRAKLIQLEKEMVFVEIDNPKRLLAKAQEEKPEDIKMDGTEK